MWTALGVAPLQQGFGAPLGIFDPKHQILAVRCLRATRVVFRPEGLERCLYRVTVVRLVVVLLVQDQPKFEARIGPSNLHAVLLAACYCLFEARVRIPVKHGPHLVVFLERVRPASTTAAGPCPFGVLSCRSCDRIWDAHAWVSLDCNHRAGTHSSDRTEVCGFGVATLTKQNEAPLRSASRSSPPQVRGSAPADLQTVPPRNGLEDILTRSHPLCGSEYQSTDRVE